MNRREILKLSAASALTALTPSAIASATSAPPAASIPKYDFFELTLHGPADGNPYLDTHLQATFTLDHRSIQVDGFYDGDGIYKLRFMPDTEGHWTYTTTSNAPALANHTGSLLCTPPAPNSHGPVSVRNIHHFAYADGTPYFPFGTTCYAWAHQGAAMEQQTLTTLASAPFNKIRMCVFPKSYEFNHNEPELYPVPRPPPPPPPHPPGGDPLTRFNPAFFAHFEQLLSRLRDLNIEADIILFHPYDRWGYASMPAEADDRYLRYVIARFSAFRNVWWSLANEYDFMKSKTTQDFDRLLRITQQSDPCQHLRSIHHGHVMFNYGTSTVTHASLQVTDFASALGWIKQWRKPVLYDECQYEGNIPRRWGNLSGPEMTRRFWLGVIAGCYVTHGDTYFDPTLPFDENGTQKLWWANGGVLRGSSPARIAFLRKLLEETTIHGLEGSPDAYYLNATSPAITPNGPDPKSPPATILYYLDDHQPIEYTFPLDNATYTAELIDPWAMTITPIPGQHSGKTTLRLPATPFQALRFKQTPHPHPQQNTSS
jgi:hypothetical protein